MSRLTSHNYEHDLFKDIYCKLRQLEDIEEELGIDLPILFTNTKVFCKAEIKKYTTDDYGMKREEILFSQIVERNLMSINLQNKTIQLGSSWSFNDYKISDYGKTWALTREELENETSI